MKKKKEKKPVDTSKVSGGFISIIITDTDKKEDTKKNQYK